MKQLKKTRTKAVMLDLDNTMLCMQIEKGTTTTLVIQSHEFVVVVDKYVVADNRDPFIKLAKVYNRTKDAYEEWLKVVGKMCKKECTSKYFDNPVMSEHISNGNIPEYLKGIVIDIAEEAISSIKCKYGEDLFQGGY